MKRPPATLCAVLCLTWLGLPSSARATSGASGGTPADSGRPDGHPGDAARGLSLAGAAFVGRAQRASGTVGSVAAGATVLVQLSDPASGWRTVATARARADGSFSAVWRAARPGRFTVRAILSAGSRAGASSTQPALSAPLSVYAAARATTFGSGFYGRRTACGTLLRPGTLGVAHRTLPCGTRVEAFYGGRRLVVSVIDRGPYVAGVTWDLTTAAADALGFPGQGELGTLAVRRPLQ
jgi:peptidoglycan lytic transglycosylase